jgi:hypothetical protein
VYNLLSKTGANPPSGWTGRCTNLNTQMEFFAEGGGGMALAVRNVKGPGSATLSMPRFNCPGGVCRLTVEYRAPVRDGTFSIQFKPQTGSAWEVAKPAVGGEEWRTEELEVNLRGATSGHFEFHNSDSSPDAVLRLRSVVVTELRKVPTATPTPPPATTPDGAGPVIYRLDADKVAPFRVVKENLKRTSGDAERLPAGVGCYCWKADGVGEFRCESVDGVAALGVTNLSDQKSAQFAFELEKGLGLSLEAGKSYRVKVEYMTRNEAAGSFTVGTLEYKRVTSADMRNTGGAWRTATATFAREEDVPVRLTIDNTTVGEGNTLLFRSVEITEVP